MMRSELAGFTLTTMAPATNEALRSALYAGEVFLLPATAAAEWLVARVRERLAAVLGSDPREAQHRMDNDAFFARLGPLRRALYLEPEFRAAVREVVAAVGFDPAAMAYDPLRLRVVKSRGEEIPAARPVYYPHRDTWYAHPPGLIVWWLPLDDLAEAETFEFFPERFAVPVPNDSEVFDYDDWVRDGWELKIGWQHADSGLTARYPGVIGTPAAGAPLGFACRRAENLLFAGAHFHRTRPQASGRTRFSLDFRLVHLGDHAAGRGAPNVDARCRGSALRDYVFPADG